MENTRIECRTVFLNYNECQASAVLSHRSFVRRSVNRMRIEGVELFVPSPADFVVCDKTHDKVIRCGIEQTALGIERRTCRAHYEGDVKVRLAPEVRGTSRS